MHIVYIPEVGIADTNGNEAAAHVPHAEKNTRLDKKKNRSSIVVQCL